MTTLVLTVLAVLAAASALAYYGSRGTAIDASLDREVRLMQGLAAEKVFGIETMIQSEDQKLFGLKLPVEQLISDLRALTTGMRVASVFVLNDKLEIIAGGYYSNRGAKEAIAFRKQFESEMLGKLPLAHADVDVRGHLYAEWDKPYLFSFAKKVSGDQTFYIVIEEDLASLFVFQFPQFFPYYEPSGLMYQIVDGDRIVYGAPSLPKGTRYVERRFQQTMDTRSVRVAQRDNTIREEMERTRFRDSLVFGAAVMGLIGGLLVLIFAIRRERRANELKSEFISNVSHELKTPLAIISMFGEMIATGRTKGPDQSTEYADTIWRESVRLTRLIDNVLDFAKLERGVGVYEFVDTDVGDVVEHAVDLVGRRLVSAEMSITVDIEPDLPHVKLDANAFTLVVMNLIDNATKYAAEGKRIELVLRRQSERIVLEVRDFGPGIEPHEQERVFERFYRAGAVRLKPIRGSGIGLALVRDIARAHHGDATVESTLGKGSTFRIWLPIPS